jgi:hypothetical protein
MHRPPLRPTLLALASACLLVLPAFAAPVELDPPDAAANSDATSIVNVTVTAGASGAPNGFTVEWMTQAVFDQLGDVWPDDPADPNIQSAIFVGTPTLNTQDGTVTFLLSPFDSATVQLGDIFDETGVQSNDPNELASGTSYVFRVKANGDPGVTTPGNGLLPASPYSPTRSCQTKAHDDLEDCVHTQGYWKNHPEKWPVNSLKVGNVIYTKNQMLLIFNQPAAGNGLISLAHQLITAKLNVAAGAVVPAVITTAIAAADAMVGNRIIPPIGGGFISPSVTSNLNDVLEGFNSDERSHGCQGTTPTRPHTWGEVKAMYRY